MRTTNDLISAVRTAIDEAETSDVSDSAILQALNRGQLRLQRIGAKRWPDLLRAESEVTVTGRTTPVPTDAYAWVVNAVDAKVGDAYFPLKAVKSSQITQEDNNASSQLPQYWSLQGNQIQVYPKASNTTLRIRYQRRLPELVASLGMINSVTAGTGSTETFLYLDEVSDDLSTSITDLAAFVNVVDPQTGEVLGTYQTTTVGSTYIGLGTPTRTTAFGRTVTSGLQTQATIEAADIEYPAQDDYVCSAAGTCVPVLPQDLSDYLVQYAVVELKRRVGEDITQEQARLTEIEKDMETLWAGRPATVRVQRVSPYWGGARTSLQTKYRG